MKLLITLLSVLLLIGSVYAAGEGCTQCDYSFKKSGFQAFYNHLSGTNEVVLPLSPVYFYDEFIRAYTVIPGNTADGGTPSIGIPWVTRLGATAGTSTVAGNGDASNGTVLCSLAADNGTQEAYITMDNNRMFTVGNGLMMEARVRLTTLPTQTTAEAFIGLIGDAATTEICSAYRLAFWAKGSGLLYANCDDNVTDTSATTGTTVVANQWVVLLIDAQTASDIKFYINGSRVCSSTTFAYAATGANLTLQPAVGVFKPAGTGQGVMEIDYVRIWQDRN